jgi:hypothetical protein
VIYIVLSIWVVWFQRWKLMGTDAFTFGDGWMVVRARRHVFGDAWWVDNAPACSSTTCKTSVARCTPPRPLGGCEKKAPCLSVITYE